MIGQKFKRLTVIALKCFDGSSSKRIRRNNSVKYYGKIPSISR
jgi:hypothetical protein